MMIKTAPKDASPLPYDQWASIHLTELVGGREYVLKHPYFPVELRARPTGTNKGYAREWAYPGDYQVRVSGRHWPVRWLTTQDLIGAVHDMCFDAKGPRLEPALESIRDRLRRVLLLNGTDEPLPSAEQVMKDSFSRYGRIPGHQWR